MPKLLMNKKQMKKAATISAGSKKDYINSHERNRYIEGIIAGLAMYQSFTWNKKTGLFYNRYEVNIKIERLLHSNKEAQTEPTNEKDHIIYNNNRPRFFLPYIDF